ncbi:MAG: GAF domain-containing protein [Thalassobaculaceae bacterium]|uniref:HWE histidine kinase domain-containing protein n=1 Tax=Roseitalea porphyridii TaxID=1852022 RepID=UPI0032EC47E5
MPSPSDPQPDIDLSRCEAEPIHRPGRIQFFGFLMAVSADWVITRVSENTGAYIGLEPEDLIGQDLSAVLSRETIHNIRTRMQMLQGPDMVERLFRDRSLDNLDRDFDISLHVSGTTTILEFEPSSDGTQDYAAYVQPMINRVSRPETIEQTCDAAVKAVRALTGFDRVMIYRFLEDSSGEVIAEVRNPGMESYLGLRYPASDIPPQARALYLRNTLRIVSDIQAPTAGIVPEFDAAGAPLDLSLSSLRAVSPVHLEYLANMGVQASMSVSIVLRGRLWGLIACHHSSPRILSFQARSATQMFGQFFALLLEKKQNEAWQKIRERAQDVHDRVVARLAEGTSIAQQFAELSEMIPQVIPCDGVIGWTEGEFNSAGATPSAAEFEELLPFLQATTSNRVFVTKRLGHLLPGGMSAPAAMAGMMVIPVSRTRPDYIVLVRREVTQTVRWAGAPHKAVTVSDDGARLSPRTSFAAWQEIVRGRSEPWTESEVRAAESLRVTLTEVILKMSEAALAERTAAHERQEILIAELNHRVRNIFNVIRGIWSQSAAAGNAVDGLSDTVGGRIQALARAYDQVTEVDWRPASLYRLLHTELAAYCTEGDDRLDLAGPDALLLPNAVSAVALVIHELTTNSTKYGALSVPSGRVSVATEETDDGAMTVVWREHGGPTVAAPTRTGFGTTLISKSVPHELGGTTTLRYPETGLEAEITVPARFVAEIVARQEPAPPRQVEVPAPTRTVSGSALLLEDNLIIALATEEMLRNVGADHVRVCANVGAALKAIDDGPVDFAVLDINLGASHSGQVADALRTRDIPFIFVTGYGDRMPMRDRFSDRPVLQKPFAEERLAAALARLTLGPQHS